MTTEVLFSNIGERIAQELSHAQQHIYIAVAWFTSPTLFNILLQKAQAGVKIQIALSNDDINRKALIQHNNLQQYGGQVFWVGDGKKQLMHHKFCVIDHHTVITGSYNWSKKAETNHENITINQDSTLAQAFIAQFYKLTEQKSQHHEVEIPIAKIIKRLEILKNYVILEDLDDISRENQKLKAYESQSDIAQIIHAISKLQLSTAVLLIDLFIKKYHSITIYQDADLIALKLEIRLLEHELNLYDNERIELEKLLADFNHQHTLELGYLISEILSLKKQLALLQNDDEAYKEAEQDEFTYNEQLADEKAKVHHELNSDEQKELKSAYRKAAFLCHPDRVNAEQKEAAAQVFNELRHAYEQNDLAKVQQILANLQQGIFKSHSETISQINQLKAVKQQLQEKLNQVLASIEQLKASHAYQEIIQLDDWSLYFAEQRHALTVKRDLLAQRLKQFST